MIIDEKTAKNEHKNYKNVPFVSDISEEDFRKLNLVGYHLTWERNDDFVDGKCVTTKRYTWDEVNLNDVLDENIEFWLEQGYESNLEDLKYPVTIAIHAYNEDGEPGYYFDKYMNRYSSPRTYEFAMGIRHIYSTRDYFESKEDYWRVLKRETKVVYRVHLDAKHLEAFKLKHTKEISYYFPDSSEDYRHYIETICDLNEECGEWKISFVEVQKHHGGATIYVPISKEKAEKLLTEK